MVKAVFSWFTGLDIQAKIIMAFFALALVGIAIATMVHVVDTLTETAEQKGAAEAAYHVGYESPSQFSREYSRMFGNPPGRDAEKYPKTLHKLTQGRNDRAD